MTVFFEDVANTFDWVPCQNYNRVGAIIQPKELLSVSLIEMQERSLG